MPMQAVTPVLVHFCAPILLTCMKLAKMRYKLSKENQVILWTVSFYSYCLQSLNTAEVMFDIKV